MDGVRTSVTPRTPARNIRMLVRRAGPEIVLLDPDNGEFHLLNAGAAMVWGMCDGWTTPEEMVATICPSVGLSRDDIASDVERILAEFEVKGLLG